MKALVEYGDRELRVEDLPTPKIADDEVLFKVRMSGLCANDARDYVGNSVYSYPRAGGHEFSGTIVDIGTSVDPSHFAVGDHVVKYILPNCGECHYCKMGRSNLCREIYTSPTFQNPGGISGFFGFAEFLAVKSRDLIKYPSGVDFTTSALTEPVACVVNSVQHASIGLGDDVVVIGGGVMGQLHLLLAKLQGARVFLSEPDEARRKLALELGADIVIDPIRVSPGDYVRSMTDGRGADVVFNTTALPAVVPDAIALTAPGGKTYMFSSLHPNEPVPTDIGRVHSSEMVIAGTVSPTVECFYRSVRLLSHGLIDVAPLIDSVFDFGDAQQAFERALEPRSLKTLIKFP